MYQELNFQPAPEVEGDIVEFRLIYRGPLPAETSDPHVKLKHAIRKKIHPQIAELWKQHAAIRNSVRIRLDNPEIQRQIDKFKMVSKGDHIYYFLPLIGGSMGTSCSLDILFLRRESAGGLIKHGGDLDNRMKTLLDALQKPQTSDHLPKDEPQPSTENPMHCLLEDDKYIDRLSITTDRLLTPIETESNATDTHFIHNVELVIQVKTIVINHRDSDPAWW